MSSNNNNTSSSIASSTNARKVARLLDINPDEEFLQGLHFLSHQKPASTSNNNAITTADSSLLLLTQQNTTATSASAASSSSNAKLVLEQNMLGAYEDLLQSLGEADRRFLAVSDSVEQLQKEGKRAQDTLQQCSSSSGALLAKVDGLVAELSEVQQREQRISSFIRSFQISDQDGLILRRGEVSHDFLDALSKLQHIHDSCKKFTSGASKTMTGSNNNNNNDPTNDSYFSEPEQQQAAVEVMESTFLLHMSSLEKVSSYIASAAPEICGGDLSALDHSTLFVEAVRALQSNPSLWAKAVHEIARVRRSAILRRLAAQSAQIIREANARQQQQNNNNKNHSSRGDSSNSSSSNSKNQQQQQQNSSLRIIGDLCAWLDESSIDERESAGAFFTTTNNNNKSSNKSSPVTENEEQTSSTSHFSSSLSVVSAHFTLQDYLDSVFDASARQLKLRAVETIQELVDTVWPRKFGNIMHAVVSSSAATTSSSSVENDSSSSSSASAAAEVLNLLEDASRSQSLVALFKTESLLNFYGERVSEVFGKSSSVVTTLNDAKLESMRYFYELLQGVSAALRLVCDRNVSSVVSLTAQSETSGSSAAAAAAGSHSSHSNTNIDDHDLSTHFSVSAACSLLRSVLEVIDQSTTPQAQRGVEAAPLLSALLDPISTSLEKHLPSSTTSSRTKNDQEKQQSPSRSAAASSSVSLGAIVYSINTLCIALSSVLPFEFANQKQQHLTTLLEHCIENYIKAAINKTSQRLELDVAHRLVSQKPRPSKESATLAMKVFFAGIFSGEGVCPLPVPYLEEIQPIRVRERCRREIVESVCEVYDEIYDIVAADIESDENARKMILHHTPEQLRILLE